MDTSKKLEVTLFDERINETSYLITAEIMDNGDLLISGDDCGEAPLKIWGDLDYEYWLTISSENKDKLIEMLLKKV